MNLQTIIGLSGVSLLLSVILFRVLNFFKIRKYYAYFFSALLFIISFISFSGDSINIYLRGLINDLSITSIILLSYYLYQPDRDKKGDKKETSTVFFIITITGLFFYPTALGFGAIDPYAWGFLNKDHGLLPSALFLSLLFGLMLYALVKKQTLLLLSLVLSTFAYQFELLESRNIWDYLFDPLLFIYALMAMLNFLFSLLNPEKSVKAERDKAIIE